MTNVLELADRLFKAVEKGDVETVRSIYSPDAVIWHNFDSLDQRFRQTSLLDPALIQRLIPPQ
jgi:ketosteroid isomerase-like protein